MTRYVATLLALGLLAAGPALALPPVFQTLKFKPGASSATVSGGAPQGIHTCYTLGARKGQKLKMRVSATADNAGVTIYLPGWKRDKEGYPDGKWLAGAQDVSRWSGSLPASGTYLVDVGGRHGGTDYKLTVEVK